MSILLCPRSTHLLMAASSNITTVVTKLRSNHTGFFNMGVSSLYSNSLHHHQVWVHYSTLGVWWNRRFTSLTCSWQICSICVMLSCQYGSESQRNVSGTLLHPRDKELRQFCEKGPVSIYTCTHSSYRLGVEHLLYLTSETRPSCSEPLCAALDMKQWSFFLRWYRRQFSSVPYFHLLNPVSADSLGSSWRFVSFVSHTRLNDERKKSRHTSKIKFSCFGLVTSDDYVCSRPWLNR